jgi:hypothetical protein
MVGPGPPDHPAPSNKESDCLGLEGTGLLHLLAVLQSPLAGGRGLCKGDSTTEGTGGGVVAQAHDADVGGGADSGVAGSAGGHLHLDGEVRGSCGRDTGDEARDVLGDLGLLEGGHVGATRGAVDHGLEGPGAVLVDLAEGHIDGAVLVGGGQTLAGAGAGHSLDHGLWGASALGALGLGTAAAASEEAGEQLADLVLFVALGGSGAAWGRAQVILLTDTRVGAVGGSLGSVHISHKDLDHHGRVDRAIALGLAQGTDRARIDLAVTDDGGVGLRAAAVGGAVTGCAISDCLGVSCVSHHSDSGVPWVHVHSPRDFSVGQSCIDLPVRPGISTPLAPVILVTTPWAETEAAKQATATEVEERIFGYVLGDCLVLSGCLSGCLAGGGDSSETQTGQGLSLWFNLD